MSIRPCLSPMCVQYPVIVLNVLTLPQKQQRKAGTLSTLSAGALPSSINGLNSMPYLKPATTGANIRASETGTAGNRFA
jgi:hypothetical protein